MSFHWYVELLFKMFGFLWTGLNIFPLKAKFSFFAKLLENKLIVFRRVSEQKKAQNYLLSIWIKEILSMLADLFKRKILVKFSVSLHIIVCAGLASRALQCTRASLRCMWNENYQGSWIKKVRQNINLVVWVTIDFNCGEKWSIWIWRVFTNAIVGSMAYSHLFQCGH